MFDYFFTYDIKNYYSISVISFIFDILRLFYLSFNSDFYVFKIMHL